jgi:hypothetical protein
VKKTMKSWRIFAIALIFVSLLLPTGLMAQQAQSHVVSLEELQHQLMAQSAQRSQDIREIRVDAALASMSDEALHQLAVTSQSINDDIEAGIATWGAVIIALFVVIAAIIIVGVVVVL